MLFKTSILPVIALVFANQAMGAAVHQERGTDGALTAVDAYAACNCPKNCDHKQGSSCKFLSGPSTTSPTIHGHCNKVNADLICIRDG